MKIKDHSGEKYNKLTVLHYTRKEKGKTFYMCRCDCGTEKEIRINDVLYGNTVSCGCYKKEHQMEWLERAKEVQVNKARRKRFARQLNYIMTNDI